MIALLLMAAIAPGQHGSDLFAGPPPSRYRHDNHIVVHFVATKRLVRHCDDGPPHPGWIVDACVDDDDLNLWAPNPCLPEFTDDAYAKDLCHELGHVNGWPDNHPR